LGIADGGPTSGVEQFLVEDRGDEQVTQHAECTV
jgi:hypothetical protein